jgi:hypothetical protein
MNIIHSTVKYCVVWMVTGYSEQMVNQECRWSKELATYEGESNENRKLFFKFNLLNESGTQLYHFST